MKKIIIIGGGIAGLSAGIYAQKLGLESVIYEKHYISGGECTGWDREGFHIDGCIHWLMGTKEGTGLNNIWKDVGALEDVDVHQPANITVAEYQDRKVFLHSDLDKFKKHLLEVAPEDREEILKLCDYIRAFDGFEMPTKKPIDLMNLIEKFKFFFSMRKVGKVMRELGKLSVEEYLERFENPALKVALESLIPGYYSAFILPSSLATVMTGNGGRPSGGSKAMAQRIEEKYKSLGGKLILKREVDKILIEDGRATGVRLADGSKEYADYIVPACDTHITFEKLLEGKYQDKKFQVRYNDEQTYPLQSSVLVSFGVDADLSIYPASHIFQTREFDFEDEKQNILSIKHYCYESSFAPDGKSVVIAYFNADYNWWKEKHDNNDYKAVKERLANELVIRMEERFPELMGKIKVIDVATPLTHERYCGAYKGSWMSFGNTPQAKQMMHDGKIKGLNNLYMAGQWLMPSGGLPTAVVTGKWAIQRIAKEENLDFHRDIES